MSLRRCLECKCFSPLTHIINFSKCCFFNFYNNKSYVGDLESTLHQLFSSEALQHFLRLIFISNLKPSILEPREQKPHMHVIVVYSSPAPLLSCLSHSFPCLASSLRSQRGPGLPTGAQPWTGDVLVYQSKKRRKK